jgi:hypothetical protein
MDCVASQLIVLRFLRFHRLGLWRSRELSREIFVPLLISPPVLIQFSNRMACNFRIAWQIVRSEDRSHVARGR